MATHSDGDTASASELLQAAIERADHMADLIQQTHPLVDQVEAELDACVPPSLLERIKVQVESLAEMVGL